MTAALSGREPSGSDPSTAAKCPSRPAWARTRRAETVRLDVATPRRRPAALSGSSRSGNAGVDLEVEDPVLQVVVAVGVDQRVELVAGDTEADEGVPQRGADEGA